MAKRIKLPTGADAEVVEHAPGEWFGRVPAELEDWDGTGAAECRLAATEAAWAEQIARNGEARKDNARKVTVELVQAALLTERRRVGRAITLLELAEAMGCDARSIRRALSVSGQSWKRLQK